MHAGHPAVRVPAGLSVASTQDRRAGDAPEHGAGPTEGTWCQARVRATRTCGLHRHAEARVAYHFDTIGPRITSATRTFQGLRRSPQGVHVASTYFMSQGSARTANGDGRPLIALAEDDAELRGLFATALEMVGYRVAQEDTGDRLVAAVRTLREAGEPLRLIITDVRMPVLGGVDAVRMLRAEGHAIPLIFMTAFGDAWTRTQAAALGAVLLDKPLGIGVLRRAVATALAKPS